MVIKPESIPLFTGDLGAVETNASTLNTAGSDFRLTGQDVHSTWQGLSAFYDAPEAATLFGATLPVRTDSDKVGDDVQEVGAALTQYAQVMRPIVNRLAAIKGEAETFVAGTRDDEDWKEDEDKVNRNNDLIRQVDTQLAAMMAAERQAANRINNLFGGRQWVVGDGSDNPNGYGFDAAQLPADAERPWGTSEEVDYPWYRDAWNMAWSDNVGFWVDGLWGDVTGLFGLINPFDWDTFSASWGGLWTLTGGLIFDTENALNAWKDFGKSMVAWDMWSEDPARAFGNLLYNIVTLPLAPAKIGTAGKAGKAAAAAADAGHAADAGRLAEAGRLADAGRVLDDLGDVGDVGRVESLPTVADLAAQIDVHLGDVLAQNPDLARALQGADALARVEAPSRVDAPEIPARVEEPVTVGGGRNGGVDVPAPIRPGTGGGGDFPPFRPGGGDDFPPVNPGRGDDLPPADPGRGDDVPPANPGDDVPANPGRPVGDPVGDPVPGRLPDEPINPGRPAEDAPGAPDRGAQDPPGTPGDDAPARPGNPGDDAPGTPARPDENAPGGGRPDGDRPLDPIRADLDDTGRTPDTTTDTPQGADDAGDAGRAGEDTGSATGDSGTPAGDAGRAGDDGPPGKYTEDKLHGPPLRDTTYGKDLFKGPDDQYHFPGDREGTHRNTAGRLLDDDTNRFTTDDNAPPIGKIDKRATPDLETRHHLVADEVNPGLADHAVDNAQQVRSQVAADKAEVWDEDIQPLADKLEAERPEGADAVELNESTLSADKLDATLLEASEHLTPQELAQLEKAAKHWNELNAELRRASENLGTAGGDLLEATEFDGAIRVTGGDSAPGTPGNLDRVLFDENGDLVAIEEKGAGSGLGSRLVEDPDNPGGPKIRAEQMSEEYLRHMLENDTKLAEALRNDPELRERIQQAIADGDVRYLLAKTSEEGIVTVTEYQIDPQRLRPDSIVVAGSDDAGIIDLPEDDAGIIDLPEDDAGIVDLPEEE